MQHFSSSGTNNFYRIMFLRTVGAILLLSVLLFWQQQTTSAQLSTPTDTNAECTPPPADLVAWWPLDETFGQVASDIAGIPNDGIHMDGPAPVTGMVAGALSFDGIDDNVVVSDHPEINFGTSDFTIDAWIRTDNADGYRPIVDKRNPGAGDAPFGYDFFLKDGRLGFNINTEQAFGNGTFAGGTATSPDLADGKWHLVAVTVERNSRTGGKLYVDGQVVHTFSTASLAGDADHTYNLIIGSRNRISRLPVDDFFAGTIDEVEIFHRTLDATEIQAIYKAQEAGKCKETLADGEIHGIKWHDVNANGVQDREPGLRHWIIYLKNEAGTVISTRTDADGVYQFTNLPAGKYTVAEIIQRDWTQTFPEKGVHTFKLGEGQALKNINFGNYENELESCHVSRHADIFNSGPNSVEVALNIRNSSDADAAYSLNVIGSPDVVVNGFTASTSPIVVPSMESAYVTISMSSFPIVLGVNGDYHVIVTNRITGHSFGCSGWLWPNDTIGVRPADNILIQDLQPREIREFVFEVHNLGAEKVEAQLGAVDRFMIGDQDFNLLQVGQVQPQKVKLGPFESTKVSVEVELLQAMPDRTGDILFSADTDGDSNPNALTSVIFRSLEIPFGCLEFNSLFHCPLGEALLSEQNNLLTVSEIGSTGQNGVYVELDRSEYVVSTLGPTSPQDATNDFSLIFTAIGTVISNDGDRFDNQQLSIVRLQSDIDGRLRISGNMGGIGTEVPRAEIYNAAGALVGRSDFGRITADMPPTFLDWAVTLVRRIGDDAVAIIDMPKEIDIVIGDDEVIRGSQIRYIGQGLARNVGVHSRLDIAARGTPSFSLKQTEAVPFGAVRIVAGNADGTAQQVVAGGTVEVPVSILDIPAALTFGSATIEVQYNPNVVKPIKCEINPDAAQKQGICNLEAAPGLILFNAVAPEAINQDTRLALILFEAIGPAGRSAELALRTRDVTDINGNSLPHVTQNGLLAIVSAIKGDVNCDSKSSAVDALFVLQNSIGSRSGIETCPLLPDKLHILGGDVNDDEVVDAVDGLFILQCDVGVPNIFCEGE